MLFFTEKGKCFWLRVFEIPEGTKTSKGRAVQNLINIEPDDKIRAFINIKDITNPEYINNNYIILCTQKGTIKKTSLLAYSRPRQNGINAININEGDRLLQAKLTNGNNEILMALKSGRAIRFNENTVRPMGRNATGVRGISLSGKEDEVIGMICIENDQDDVLVVSENGYGKRSKLDDYRVTNRGGKGVKTINITEKTGHLISIKNVTDNDDLMIINKSGLIIRLAILEMRVMGRATQGVRLINLKEGDAIAAVAKVEVEEEEKMLDNEEIIEHERILFERFMNILSNQQGSSQQLLFPQPINLSPSDTELVKDLMPYLKHIGFDIDEFGKNSFIINGTPTNFPEKNINDLIEKVLDNYKLNLVDLTIDKKINLANAMAKNLALKSGKFLDVKEIESLIDELFTCNTPNISLSGKPSLIILKTEEIDYKFK